MNVILIRGARDILVAVNLSFILSFLVDCLHFVGGKFIDIGHVGIYFVFGILLYFAFICSRNYILDKYSAVCAVCIGTAYGVLNEIFQSYLPFRTASVGDAFSNMLGLVLAQLLVLVFIFVLRQLLNRTKGEKVTVN